MIYYYSATTNGFYVDSVHGSLMIDVIDPNFQWPTIDVPDPGWQGDPETAPMIETLDESIEPPMVQVPNPSTKIPDDAVEISAELHEYITNGENETHHRSPDDNGYPTLTERPPIPLAELAERKRQELDAARDAAFAAGLEYDFNGETDVVQTRPQDQVNLLGLQAKAQRLIAAGQPDTPLTFRGLNNVNRELTATEIDALTLAALGHIEGIYQKSWQLKDRLDAALEAEDREGIEQLFW